jgi:hypothetical protein
MSMDFVQKSYLIAHARHESVMNEARRMAKSGEYANSRQIEIALRETDLAESVDVLGGAAARAELDKLCREACHLTVELTTA